MLKGNSFLFALSFSSIGHVFLFAFLPSHLGLHDLVHPKEARDVEVTYFQIRDIPKWGGSVAAGPDGGAPAGEARRPSDGGKEEAIGAFADVRPVEAPSAIDIPKPTEGKTGLSKEEAFYQEMASRLQDPVFMTYYQGIREKIRQAAKRRYQGRRSSGDVEVGFTLFSNGRLKEAMILKKGSSESSLLGPLAVQSLVDASPFPSFPAPLERERLSFVVVLTFTLNP